MLTLQPAGAAGTVRAELSRERGGAYSAGDEGWFCLPKEHVMPLTETHGI